MTCSDPNKKKKKLMDGLTDKNDAPKLLNETKSFKFLFSIRY